MEKIKLLYVITSVGLGGAEKLLLSYVKNLNKNKYSLYVCCLREKPDDLFLDISKYSTVYNLKINNRFNPIIIFALIKLIREIKPDIIHTHLFQARVYTAVAKLFYKHSVIITQKHNNVNLIKHNVFILFELLSLLIYNKVIAISESVKNSLIRYEFVPSRKIFVLPNCIDFLRFHNSGFRESLLNKQEIIIGTVGRIERQKGIKYLLLAMNPILSKYPNTKLEIIGDGSLLNEMKNLSINLNISNSVFFFGKFVDVIPFYRRMDVFVLSSVYEGFGIVLLEAMASGVPIVATNVDGIKEVVTNMNSGILVPPKNPEAIADAVVKIIENPLLSKNLVDKGYKRAKLFDVQEHIAKLDSFYTNLLGLESYK